MLRPVRRPIAHLTGASAVLAVAVAASLALAPGTAVPGEVRRPASAGAHGTPLPAALPGGAELRDAFWPVPQADGGSARPIDLQPIPEPQRAALQAAVDRARATFGLGAVAVGVSADGIYGWSGASGPPRDGHTPLSGATPFAIASVTKTFSVAVVLQLVDERRIRLDAPVTDYLPELTLARGVTVRQLLSHTSGIADLLAPMRSRLNAQPSRVWQPAEVLALIGPPTFAPGSGWGYSNTNYVIAGLLVERVTGSSFADELKRRITGPMKLLGTGVEPSGNRSNLLGVSWASAFWTAAAIDSDASDLVRWGDALYGGRILTPATLAQMLAFNADGYGLGAERYTIAGLVGYGHSGLLRGYTTLLVHLPEAKLTIAVLANGHLFDATGFLTYEAPGARSILSLAQAISPS